MDPGLAQIALGLRFLMLAVVAGSGVFLLPTLPSRGALAAGVLGSAALGLAHYATARRRPVPPAGLFVLAQVLVWMFLLHVSGGQRSPLFMGLLLEIPLAGSTMGRRGCLVAAISAAGAYAAYAALVAPRFEPEAVLLACGFIAAAGSLTWVLLGILDRQRVALAARAETIATELRLLGDYLGDAFLSVDELGRVAGVNRSGAALLGIEGRAAIGRPWQEVLRPGPDTAACILRTLSEGDAQHGVPLLLRRPDGAAVVARGDLWVSPSPHGRRLHLLIDPCAEPQSGDDPMRRLGEAAACVAHQIKNSLQALRGLASAARDGGGARDGDRPHLLGALRDLGELADNVLAVAGSSRPLTEDVPVSQAIGTAVLLAHPGDVRVTLEPGAEGLYVRTHRGSLVQALFNLIDNACRATRPGAGVRVRVEHDDDSVCVEIVDGGPGLPPGADGTHGPVASRSGAGLGIVAARRFLEACGGGLTFAPAPGGGTICRVTVPIGAASRAPVTAPARG